MKKVFFSNHLILDLVQLFITYKSYNKPEFESHSKNIIKRLNYYKKKHKKITHFFNKKINFKNKIQNQPINAQALICMLNV